MPVAQFRFPGDAQGFSNPQLPGELIDRPDRPEALRLAETQGAGGSLSDLIERLGGLVDGAADGVKDVGGEMGEDSQGFGFDLRAATVGLAQQDRGVRFALFSFGDNFCNKNAYNI